MMNYMETNDDITPVKLIDGRKVLGLDNYCVYQFVAIANRLSSSASARYREEFGVGIVEWRCMVMLALEDGVSAARICQVGGINKALVSRSLARLEELGYVEDHEETKRKPRYLKFTASGRKLYDRMLKQALRREETLREGLSDSEIRELLRLLHKISGNVNKLAGEGGPKE
ncbi:MarR family winged helix-turn-helix transcriptional regulator [Emcibacter nanhaiensis]|uniref:Winged helix-turn-helix transcriptional regulator n=1 Tax=Emcibacter nanhaiensis TaxID=1505037 RepID=A0A501PF13_9PROT|nr:MarR family winged helix-turn-helix transcriptional regulator [Emcibacter nanhaiensis]TPD59029.1 winged helix-turn-helix transcriptional regulator [Emcibacter nanhaiensis]